MRRPPPPRRGVRRVYGLAAFADLSGLRGIRVENPSQVEPAWEEALRADRPVVIDAVVDPEEPPLPPHITFEQARKFAEAMLHEPAGAGVAAQALKEKAGEFLPGRG